MYQRGGRILWAVVLLAGAVGAAGAQDLARTSVAEADYSSMELRFVPRIGAKAWSLRVTGPAGFLFERKGEGTPPAFSVFNRTGQPLPDGTYSYELRAELRLGSSAFERGDADSPDGRVYSLRPEAAPAEVPTVSGTFTVSGGGIVVPEGVEPASRLAPSSGAPHSSANEGNPAITNDQVIADDLIVQGSACVGIDCVNNESFGFDTLRLKENNTRLAFDDTSVSAGFPANDWQLSANDSASGGANKFTIEDVTGGKTPFTVTAGAPTHSIFVDSTGRLGLKTSTPVLDIHTVSSNTPALRLEQSAAAGYVAQTWDVAGNETVFFVRDVTGGSKLPFKIESGTPTNSLYLDSGGNVGLGTNAPQTVLHLVKSTDAIVRVETTAGSHPETWDIRNNVQTGRLHLTDDPTNARVPFKIGQNSGNNLLRLGIAASNQVDISGNLVIYGGTITPDYVFDPTYRLESIDEHAAMMWQERHLPGVAAAQTNAEGMSVINVSDRSQGMLEELEKAHIYIEQLSDRLETLSAAVEERDAAIAGLRAEIETIKSQLRP